MRIKNISRFTIISVFAFALALAGVWVKAQTTSFTYQWLLTDGGNPTNGAYDLQFKLFSALSDSAQQGSVIAQLCAMKRTDWVANCRTNKERSA